MKAVSTEDQMKATAEVAKSDLKEVAIYCRWAGQFPYAMVTISRNGKQVDGNHHESFTEAARDACQKAPKEWREQSVQLLGSFTDAWEA